MTEFSINNDINNKTHLSSQPLQNSPRHHFVSYSPLSNNSSATTATLLHQHQHPHQHQPQHQHQYQHQPLTNSPQHFAQFNRNLTQTLKQTLINHNNNQQTQPPTSSSSANLKLNEIRSPSSVASSVTHSPTHYRNPFNSPNNSPFAYNASSYADNNVNTTQHQHQQQQSQQQQHHYQYQQSGRGNISKLPSLSHTQYQQHLNDLLLQQQHLQQQQQQLLQAKDPADEELSEESLKQNVAIVLSNLDRYNNALRSIILNEQVIGSSSSVFYDESDLHFSAAGGNNNLLANMATAITPESDYNSNPTTPGSRSNTLSYESGNMVTQHQLQAHQHLVGFSNTTNGGGVGNGLNNACGGVVNNGFMGNNLNCSLASSHDFTHDNSDYQWFLDYGYRDGYSGMQRSVLSSLSASYNGLGDLIYEDLSKNIDANLAEVDIESFRAEDIHSLLSQLPSYCKNLTGNRLQQSLTIQQQILPYTTNNGGQQQQQQQQIQLNHTVSQISTSSTNDLIDNSICKSELLFSPVKESHISVDSLDMDAYPEDGDIILTCKANKDNYTIAFEGSVLYSDDSFYEPNEIALKNKQNCINLHSNLDDIVKRKSLEVSMSRSEQPQTNTRNRLQKSHTTQLQRYPSGNNNTAETITIIRPPLPIGHGGVRKCSSLPNLRESKDLIILNENLNSHRRETPQKLNVSQAISSSTVETNLSAKSRNLLPMCQMPISCSSVSGSIDERLNAESGQYQAVQMALASAQRYPKHRCCCGVNNQSTGVTPLGSHQLKQAHISGSSSSGSSNPPAFNLVKLFIKQKSSNCSLEDQPSAHTCMDVSSGCWPSSDANGSSSSSSLEQRLRKKSMNDSGKGSALSRHEEEADTKNSSTFLLDVSASTPKQSARSPGVFHDKDTSSSSSGSLTATNSPAHRRRNVMPLRNPTLSHLANQHNTNSGTSLQSSDNTSEQLTQVFMSSIASTSLTEQNIKERKFKNNERREGEALQPISNASSSEMITRSMQTSCGSLSTRSSLSDRFRCVPPSFLEKLNNLGEERQAPIYVIYPNYALPDLGFVKNSATPDVIFSPFNYKMTLAGATSSSSPNSSFKKRFNVMGSSEEGEILMTMDYKHVVDWASLVTLLPVDYRRRLKHIPEVNSVLKQLESELPQKPLFCLTPAVRRNRPHICDCAQYFQKDQQTEAAGSSSSGSSQQPSSGYRGSSTLLTDSDLTENVSGGGGGDPLKPMYVYQYEQQRMDSGAEVSPKIHSMPQAMPRGILRKSSSAVRNKRNSMIEQSQQANSKLNKIEKRRSLQEPPYRQQVGSAEELSEVFEEEVGAEIYPSKVQPKAERLSRKDLDARLRAENFLSSLPRNELKYYAEIAAILESSEHQVQYDAVALKKEVSRVLSQQKKVSFNDFNELQANTEAIAPLHQLQQGDAKQRFATPPNSPNISMASGAAAALRLQNINTRNCSQRDDAERRKLESNRFKRLQIQWELMSKESSMLKELANAQQTKSGASTPTSAITANAAYKSRIPRPVSYPAGKRKNIQYRTNECNKLNSALPKPKPQKSTISPQNARITIQADNKAKTTRSPSRIVPPKRYSVNLTSTAITSAATSPSTPTTPAGIAGVRARTPNSRVAVTAPNTPKRRVQSPRTIPRIR